MSQQVLDKNLAKSLKNFPRIYRSMQHFIQKMYFSILETIMFLNRKSTFSFQFLAPNNDCSTCKKALKAIFQEICDTTWQKVMIKEIQKDLNCLDPEMVDDILCQDNAIDIIQFLTKNTFNR